MSADSATTAILADGLTRRYGGVLAVDHLSFAVGPGTFFGLVGPDGAGKSTTLRMLAAVLDPSEGTARVAGYDVRTQPEEVKARLGYMPQRFGLYGDLTVLENLRFYAEIYQVSAAGQRERVPALLEFGQLTPFAHRPAWQLSGGMKQKLALACALVHRPEVLLLDEPTTGVDPVARREFWRILHQLQREGVTVVLATPYMDEAERCAMLGLMHAGRLVAVEPPDHVRRLMRGEVIEVLARPRGEARRLLRALPDTRGLAVFGDRLHVTVEDAGASVPRIAAHLRAHGLEVTEVRRIEPSLEDVFIALVEQGERVAAGTPSPPRGEGRG